MPDASAGSQWFRAEYWPSRRHEDRRLGYLGYRSISPRLWRLPVGVADFVAGEDVVGVPQLRTSTSRSEAGGLPEDWDPFAQDDVANHQMDLIDQVVRQEIRSRASYSR